MVSLITLDYNGILPLNIQEILNTMIEKSELLPSQTKGGKSKNGKRLTSWKRSTFQWLLANKCDISLENGKLSILMPYYIKEWYEFDMKNVISQDDIFQIEAGIK